MRHLVYLLFLVASANAADVWVGLRTIEYNDDGKINVNYTACQISDADIETIKSGKNIDGFVEARNVMYIDSDEGTYEMNSESINSKEETDRILYKVSKIHQLVFLKDDPRKLYAKRAAEPEKAAEKGVKAAAPDKW